MKKLEEYKKGEFIARLFENQVAHEKCYTFKIYYKEAKRGKHVAENFVYYLNLQTCKNVIREQLELLNSIKEINGTPTLEMWYNSYHQK